MKYGNLFEKIRADAPKDFPSGSLQMHLLMPVRYQPRFIRFGIARYKWNFIGSILLLVVHEALIVKEILNFGEPLSYGMLILAVIVLLPAIIYRPVFLYWFDLRKEAKRYSAANQKQLDEYAQELQNQKRIDE